MFKRNELTNIVQQLDVNGDIECEIHKQLIGIVNLHSFIVYNNGNDYTIAYNISQQSEYNKIYKEDCVNTILKAIKNNTNKRIICFGQPPLLDIIKQRKFMIIKLAQEQHEHWNNLEMEDLIQMCNYVICNLYNKGYYIHRNLVRRCYINYVLAYIYKERDRPQIVSLEQEFATSDSDDKIQIKDTVPDIKYLQEQEDAEDFEIQARILCEMRDIVVDYIGVRQYDQLLREYGNKQTTNWSRKLMMSIKAHLFEMGISKKSFDKYYG